MDRKAIKVLLLDDDPNLRGVVSDILRVKGFEPIPAGTGAAALARIEKLDIDVVLIDIKLEDMSGLDVLRGIKARSPGTECIMLTGHASQNTAIEAVNLGAYCYFQKPYEVDQLLVAIRRAAEKHIAGHALLEREARFRSMIENASDLICILNPDATLRYISPSVERILGYSVEEVVGESGLQEFLHPDDSPAFMKAFHQRVQTSDRSPAPMQLRVLHKDGTWRTLEGTGSNLLDDPAVEGIIINARDVTERRQAEEDIRRMVQRWSIVYRAGEEIGASLDTEQIYAAVHRAVAQVMPCDDFVISLYDEVRNEMRGNYILEKNKRVTPNPYVADRGLGGFIVHSGRSLLLNSPQQISASGIKFVPYGRGPVTASVVAVPLQLKGKTIGIISAQSYKSEAYAVADQELLEMLASHAAVAIDNARMFEQAQQEILERKRAEEALKESQQSYQKLVEQIPGVIYQDALDEKATTLYIGPQIKALTGYSAEEWVADPDLWTKLLHPDDRLRALAENKHHLVSGERFKSDYRLTGRDGSIVWVRDEAVTIRDSSGHPLYDQGVFTDITERMQAEDLIRQQREQLDLLYEASQRLNRTLNLEEIYQAICDFMSVVAPNDGLVISTYDPETHLITCRAYWMENKWLDVSSFPAIPLEEEGKGTQSLVIRTGQPMLINDYQARMKTARTSYYVDSETNEVDKEAPPDEDVPRSALIVPLKTGDHVSGVIQVMSYRLNAYTENQLKLLESLALRIAPAEQNALLYAQVQAELNERKLAEEKIRLSEERYRMLAENMSDTIWLMDMSLRTTYISPSVTRLRGFTLDEINTIPLDRQMPPDSLQRALQMFAEIISPETLPQPGQPVSRTIELEFYKKDGTKFWSENTFTLIRDPLGQPFAILGSGRDINERKQSEETLRNSEKYFRALIENNTDAVVLVDPRGMILYESPSYARMMGRARGQRLGKSGYEFIHPDDRGPVAKIINELVREPGGIRRATYRTQHKDGSWCWIDATATNLLGESGVHGIVINMQDITERQQAEVEIRRRVADLEVLYENGLSISVLLEPREIARKMIGILIQKLDWHHAAIRLYDPKTRRLELLALNRPGLTPAETQAEIDRVNQVFKSPNQGLSGWVITHGKTVRLGDVQADERFLATFEDIRSGLYVPLMIGKRAIGSVTVESRQADRFSEDDERLLQTLAAQSAIAFENARRYQEAVSASKRKAALHQGGLDIVQAGQDVEALCTALHQAAQKVMPAEVFVVSLITEDGREVEAPYLSDQGIRRPNSLLPVSAGIAGAVIKGKKPLRIKDMQKSRRVKPIMPDGVEPTRSVLSVPLLTQEKIVGVLSVESRQPDVYSAEDQIFMETLASEAAVAFENARLYKEAVSSAERSAVLYHAGQEIAAAGLDLEQVYRSIHQAVTQLMPHDLFTIVLADENQQALHAVYLFDRGKRYPAFDPPWGSGLSGHVITGKQSLRIADYSQEKLVKAVPFGAPGMPSSILAVPLHSGEKIVGVLSVQDYRVNIYKENDEILLKTLAAQAGTAIENSRLFEETRQRLAELESLSQVSISLTSAIDLQPLLENILAGARNAIPAAEKGTIFLTEPDNTLRMHAMSGYTDPRLAGMILLPDQKGYAARVARERTPIKIDDAHAEYDIPDNGMIAEVDAILSGIAAPLIVKGKVIGVISLDNALRKAAFSESDLRLLVTFASSAAVAIENARLFTETQQRLHRLTALHSVDAAIGASVDTHVTLNIVLENIMSELKADAASVLLFNPLTRMLEYTAGRGFHVHAVEGLRLRLGEGLAGQSALQRRSINIADLQQPAEVQLVMQSPVSGSTSAPLQYLEGEGFVAYHAIPLIAKGQVVGVLEIFRRTPMQVDREWTNFFELLAGQTAIAVDNGRLFENLQQSNLDLTLAYDATIQGWSQALELRDQETEGHTLRVTDLTMRLIQSMGIEEVETEHVRRGALLHDIGKMAIPDSILLKPGPLDEREWSVMRQHPQYAYNLLSPIVYLRLAIHIPYCHHEKWDGSGYPRALKGDEIPMVARIFSIVDVYDALTSNRPYRPAWTREHTLEYIREQSGSHFDPKVVKAFMALMAG